MIFRNKIRPTEMDTRLRGYDAFRHLTVYPHPTRHTVKDHAHKAELI